MWNVCSTCKWSVDKLVGNMCVKKEIHIYEECVLTMQVECRQPSEEYVLK